MILLMFSPEVAPLSDSDGSSPGLMETSSVPDRAPSALGRSGETSSVLGPSGGASALSGDATSTSVGAVSVGGAVSARSSSAPRGGASSTGVASAAVVAVPSVVVGASSGTSFSIGSVPGGIPSSVGVVSAIVGKASSVRGAGRDTSPFWRRNLYIRRPGIGRGAYVCRDVGLPLRRDVSR